MVALSATPGTDNNSVQQVVTNLKISKIELRTEESLDVIPYIHLRRKEIIVLPTCEKIVLIREKLNLLLTPILERLKEKRIFYEKDPNKVSKFQLLTARNKWRLNRESRGMAFDGSVEGDFATLMSLSHACELLMM